MKPSIAVSSSAWRDSGVIRDSRAWAMPSGIRLSRMARLFLDIGRRPDCVEGPVEAEPRIDVARKGLRARRRSPPASPARNCRHGSGCRSGRAHNGEEREGAARVPDQATFVTTPLWSRGPMGWTPASNATPQRLRRNARKNGKKGSPAPSSRQVGTIVGVFCFHCPRGPIIRVRRNLGVCSAGTAALSCSCRRTTGLRARRCRP